MITLTKYKNRRIYSQGQYLSLKDIGALVRGGQPFRVVCAQTKLDITRAVLIQCAYGQLGLLADEELRRLINGVG